MNEEEEGEQVTEYINALLEVLYYHQQFLLHKGIDKQEFEDYLNELTFPYSQTIH